MKAMQTVKKQLQQLSTNVVSFRWTNSTYALHVSWSRYQSAVTSQVRRSLNNLSSLFILVWKRLKAIICFSLPNKGALILHCSFWVWTLTGAQSLIPSPLNYVWSALVTCSYFIHLPSILCTMDKSTIRLLYPHCKYVPNKPLREVVSSCIVSSLTLTLTRFPPGLENLEIWVDLFQSGKSQGEWLF